jgi:hypothetical protein
MAIDIYNESTAGSMNHPGNWWPLSFLDACSEGNCTGACSTRSRLATSSLVDAHPQLAITQEFNKLDIDTIGVFAFWFDMRGFRK